MPTTTLYLTRHAEQQRDPSGGDAPDADLTANGVRQAHRLGARLADVPLDVLRHGPLPRAARTAHLLAGHFRDLPVEETDLLQDRTPIPTGADAAQLPARYQAFLDAVPPEERDEDATALGAAAAALLVTSDHDRSELLVTHTFVIGWFVRHVLGAPAWRWLGLNHAHCALTTIAVHDDRPPTLLGYNDVGHLP